MGAFDDLIPSSRNKPVPRAFDDLLPSGDAKKAPGVFDDLMPERPSMLKQIAMENPATAIAEAGINLATTGAALPVAGLAGLAVGAGNALGLTERTGADTVNDVTEALTYQPRGEMGKAAAGIVAYPFEKLNEAATFAGEKTREATDSPAAATAVHTLIEGVAPLVAGPAVKTGKSRITGRAEAMPEGIVRESQVENPAPAVVEAARPADSALVGDSATAVMEGRNGEATQTRAQRLVGDDPALREPQAQGFPEVWREGDSGLSPVDGELRAVPGRHGAGADADALAGPAGRDGGLLPRELLLDDTAGAGEAPRLLPEGGDQFQGNDGRRGREIARAADAEFGPSQSGARFSAERVRVENRQPVDVADLQRRDAATPRDGEAFRSPADTAVGAPESRLAARSRAEPDTQQRPAPILDTNAGPLSRSAAIARPDLVKAKEAAPAGPFADLLPDSAAVREATRMPAQREWAAFAPESGSLGVPRAEMPQIKAEHRGAMTQFMEARGISHKAEAVAGHLLKPTQAEFSPAKVKKAMAFEGGDRSILVSSDGYVLDGHHQWLAKREKGEAIKVIRFDAPIADLVRLAHEFPSSQRAKAGQAGTEYSFAPGANYAPLIDDARAPAAAAGAGRATGRAEPIRREDVIVPFAKALGASIYTGRVKMKNALGFFRRGNEEVRIKRHADLEVTAHEMAHLIDSRVVALSNEWRANTKLRNELKSVSYDHKSVTEGFAEAVRLWMTQPEVLQQRAPLAYSWLENFTQTDKRYGPAMRKAQEGMTGWFAQDAVDRARSKIGDHRPLSDAMNGALDRFRQSVSDDLHGVYRMERELQGGQLAPVGAYESARLSRASASIADGAVRFGYPVKNADGSFSYRGKGLQQILEPVGKNLDDALLYFVGRSAQELMLQGREHLFTKGEIRGMLALETPEARKAFAEYQAWNRGVLDFAEAQGVLNGETRRKWKRVEYLPFHRVQQPGGLKGKPGDWQGIQALTGGTENIKDVLGNMIGNAAQLIDVAVKNEARVKIATLASKPGGGKFMAKIDAGSRPVKVGGDQVLKEMFDRYGIAIDGDAPAFFEFMIHGQPPAGGNVVAVLRDGKPVWYEVADPILLRSLLAIDRPPMPWLTRWLGMPKRVGQATITMTPDFMLANIARDTIMASVMSRAGFRPVIDSLQGMRLRMTSDPLYKDFIANGGGLSSIFTDEAKVRAKLERFYHDQGIDARAVLDAPDKLISAIETIADAFEVSSRIGEYKRAIERREHPRHAAYLGREVSADFAMRGDSKALGFLYDTVLFMKAAVVSWDRLARGVAHDPNKAAIGAKAALLAAASAGLYLLNRDNPRYQDLPDWQKDSYWHFFVPKPDGTEAHYMWPKIWEVGSLASMAERTTGTILNDDPNGLGKDFARIIGHTFNLNLMPQIVAPLYEQATNRNGFTKTPIETPGMENVQPFLRAKPNTSETIKALGMATRDLPESLQVPPARAEALLRGYLNTWAMYGLMLSDQAFFGDQLPEMRTDQLPVVRRFYQDEPARGTKFESQFYDMLGEAKRLQGTLRELDRQGRPDIADQKEQSPLAGESKPLERANKSLQTLNAEMKDIRRADDLTPAEKRQRLDSLTVERNQLLKDAVQAAKAAQGNR